MPPFSNHTVNTSYENRPSEVIQSLAYCVSILIEEVEVREGIVHDGSQPESKVDLLKVRARPECVISDSMTESLIWTVVSPARLKNMLLPMLLTPCSKYTVFKVYLL